MNTKKTFNTIYVECHNPIWDYYFRLDGLVYKPKVIVGEERQRGFAKSNNIEFFTRTDFNNLEIKLEYATKEETPTFVNEILQNRILFQMYKRNSFDNNPEENLINDLTLKYSRIWLSLIKRFNLEVLILHEMPHLPYSYIGYLIFKSLGLKTIFSATLRFEGKTYFVDKFENYSFFKDDRQNYLRKNGNDQENSKYFEKLQAEYGFNKESKPVKSSSFIRCFLIYFRNFLFPNLTNRLRFKVIQNGQFVDINNRKYYFLILLRLLKKLRNKFYYKKIVSNMQNDKRIKIFFALHYEPELAVYPLAGDNFNQFEIIFELSKKLGDKGFIYVKEHPWVFDFSKEKGIVRETNFYKILSSQKNIRFLDYKTDTNQIIKDVDLIATLTGTIGWEMFFKKIPVIYFGYTWYGGLPGIRKYTNDMDIEEFIQTSKNEFASVNYTKIFNELDSTLHKVSVKLNSLSNEEFTHKAILLKSSIESV